MQEFHADKWWWILVETSNKLIITGILPFIAKGRAAQVVAGLFISFGFLLLYVGNMSYAEKAFRQVRLPTCCRLAPL